MNHEPDPAAIFACAHSLWDACQKAIAADSKLNLGEAYNGMDQFMRELMRVASHFEIWSCQHLDFSELDEGGMRNEPREQTGWKRCPTFLQAHFGETCRQVATLSPPISVRCNSGCTAWARTGYPNTSPTAKPSPPPSPLVPGLTFKAIRV